MSRDAPPPATSTLDGSAQLKVPDTLWLVVLSGPDQGRTLRLQQGTFLVGKDPDCSLVLTDASVSRKHVRIDVGPERIVVEDLDSKNGSFYQGARFSTVEVRSGAAISVGSTELRFASVLQGGHPPPSAAERFGGLIGKSLAMREVFAVLERIARTEATVLIQGETGTGKDVCARAIHQASPRAKAPFVVCDVGAISRTLIESELFGHRRGAFTGAERDRDGCFVVARGGTIFIDEVGELELDVQPRLLRVLEQRQVRPVGATGYQDVDVRVIAATNRDLREECSRGRFREDLYHRLSIVPITLPPLRQRPEDISALVDALMHGRQVTIPAQSKALLGEYDWPGNVRQLSNVLERAVSMLGDAHELTPDMLGMAGGGTISHAPDQTRQAFHAAKERMVADWERTYLSDLLRRADGNIARASRLAGLGRPHLYRLLKKHGLYRDA